MSLATKMYIKSGTVVPCVNRAAEADLADLQTKSLSFEAARKVVMAGEAPSLFVFVENSTKLLKQIPNLQQLWRDKVTFWLFYPKAPHLKTDLGRDKTWEIMKKNGMSGTRQVGIDQLWSCIYFKNKD